MDKISTPNLAILHLYENPDTKLPASLKEDKAIENEWNELKSTKKAVDNQALVQPSNTSISIIMAYAMNKEETAPSY